MNTRNHKKRELFEDEREKIRQSILKVFRSRMRSPVREGAILTNVFPPHKTTDQIYELDCSPYTSMSDNDDDKKLSLKHKRRRKKSERNKLRSKTTVSKSQVHQHMKKVHDVSLKSDDREMAETRPVKRYSSITQSRLTTRLGLFNKGKKSDTIARGPIKVSDAMREKTQKDLKKILNISDSDSQSADLGHEKENYFNSGEHAGHHLVSNSSHSGHKSLPGSTTVTPLSNIQPRILERSHGIASGSSTACSPTPKIIVQDTLPESPPLESMARTLLSELKPWKMFPGYYYLQELQDELNKLMKQNAPGHTEVTPVRHTPGSVNSETVKRSLLKSLLEATDTPDKEVLRTRPKTPEGMETDTHQQVEQASDPNHQHMQTAPPGIPGTTDLPDANIFADAKSLLSHNDTMIASKSLHPDHGKIEQSIDPCRNSAEGYMNDRQSQSSQSSGYCSHHTSSVRNADPRLYPHPAVASAACGAPRVSAKDNHLAVVAKFHEHPEYMPRFHGDYYKDKIAVAEHTWPDSQSYNCSPSQVNPMDLLEMVDEGTARTLSPIVQTHPSLIRATPDSDGSPLFLPQNLLPLKPSFETPSTPQKLYPRRLY